MRQRIQELSIDLSLQKIFGHLASGAAECLHPTFKSFIAQPGVQDYCCKMPAAQISLVLVKGTRSVGISKFEVVFGEAQKIVKTLPS